MTPNSHIIVNLTIFTQEISNQKLQFLLYVPIFYWLKTHSTKNEVFH